MKTTFVIPAYNEGRHIVSFLKELKDTLRGVPAPYEIIVVNDGSADDTSRKAREAGVKVIDHAENMGYGRSLKDGIRGASGEYIFIMDADGTYDVGEIPRMLRLVEDADLVVGKRVFSKGSGNHLKNVARRFFAYQVSYYANKKVEDLNSGQRVFKRSDVIDKLDEYPDGFSFTSTQIVLYLLDRKKIVYTPVSYNHREAGSKFLSRSQIAAMARLSFGLTFRGRPFLMLTQLAGIVTAAAVFSKIKGDAAGAGAVCYVDSFIVSILVLFFILLCYIYARGRAVPARS